MSALRQAVDDYLTIRRSLGYKLERHGRLLPQFVDYLDRVDATAVTIEHAVAWATLPAGGEANLWAERLSVVRGFTTWLAAFDPATQIPPSDLLPYHPQRAVPHLFSDVDVAALLAAAATIRTPFRAATFTTLLGLLAVTGMRIGEALALDRRDLDIRLELLVVRSGKFGKARELPLHHTTIDALTGYLARGDRPATTDDGDALFVATVGTRLRYRNVATTFRLLVDQAGLVPRPGTGSPRLHSFRHSFVVNTMLDAYRADIDVQARLPVLSTYLGHVDPANTYWYLTAAPELMALAGRRLEVYEEAQS
jgi:integrase